MFTIVPQGPWSSIGKPYSSNISKDENTICTLAEYCSTYLSVIKKHASSLGSRDNVDPIGKNVDMSKGE